MYLGDGSAQTIVRAATLRQKLQIKLSLSPRHNILTPDQPVPQNQVLRFKLGKKRSTVIAEIEPPCGHLNH